MKNTKKGFTLVELLVVIAILAILASVAVVGYTAFLDKAEESNAKTELHQIETSVEANLMIGDDTVLFTAADDVAATADKTSVIVSVYVDGETGKVMIVKSVWVAEATVEEEVVPAHAELEAPVVANDDTITLNGDFNGLINDGDVTVKDNTLKYLDLTITFDK